MFLIINEKKKVNFSVSQIFFLFNFHNFCNMQPVKKNKQRINGWKQQFWWMLWGYYENNNLTSSLFRLAGKTLSFVRHERLWRKKLKNIMSNRIMRNSFLWIITSSTLAGWVPVKWGNKSLREERWCSTEMHAGRKYLILFEND